MPRLAPCLFVDGDAEEAAAFYTAIFPNSRVLQTSYAPESVPGETGSVMMVIAELDGQKLMLLNGRPSRDGFAPNESVSLMVECADQAEIDHYWERLTADGGEENVCGWLRDRFGFSWQVAPAGFAELIERGGPEGADRVMAAVMGMRKLDLAAMERAAAG